MSVSVDCANCGIVFRLTDSLHKRRLKDHQSFYCPNGHLNFYPGKTDEEKKIESLERDVRMLEADYNGLYAQREEMIGAFKECPIIGCGWHSRKQIPRDTFSMGRGIERVRHDLLEHFVRDHSGRVHDAPRELTAGTA